jgi:hypothetical protein
LSKEILARKLPSCGRTGHGQRSYHHVNRRCSNSSWPVETVDPGACAFVCVRVKNEVCKSLCFHRYGDARVRQGRVCVSAVAGLNLDKLLTKCASHARTSAGFVHRRFQAQNSVNSMVRPRYAGLQPGVTKRTGTAACKKALVMLRHCYARLQLEVAKCIVTAAGMIVFKLRLSRYAVHKRTAMAAPREELGHRSYRKGSPEKQ